MIGRIKGFLTIWGWISVKLHFLRGERYEFRIVNSKVVKFCLCSLQRLKKTQKTEKNKLLCIAKINILFFEPPPPYVRYLFFPVQKFPKIQQPPIESKITSSRSVLPPIGGPVGFSETLSRTPQKENPFNKIADVFSWKNGFPIEMVFQIKQVRFGAKKEMFLVLGGRGGLHFCLEKSRVFQFVSSGRKHNSCPRRSRLGAVRRIPPGQPPSSTIF